MLSTEQMEGLSVLEHGQMVHNYFVDLRNQYLEDNYSPIYSWRLPEWALSPELWGRLVDEEIIHNYQVFHDCGKPYCLNIDAQGRRHFPEHADVSAEVWGQVAGSTLESDLMRHDMDIHLMKSKDFESFSKLDIAPTLLLTGLAEIHANAEMFGGIDSTSFKIKWKNINKFGRRYVNLLKEKEVA